MLNEVLNLIVKLLKEGAGPKLREAIGTVAAGGELPYGTAIAELVKQQNLMQDADLDKIIALVLALLGSDASDKKAEVKRCTDCPYAACQQAEEKPLALPESRVMEFDLDRAPSTLSPRLALPDEAAKAEDALQARIRALAG